MKLQITTELRALLYSHDSFGLGHVRRNSSIAHAIAAAVPGASQLCVTGSPRSELFPLPAGADYVKLPSVTKSAMGDYVALGLECELDELVHVRAQTIAAVARSFRPHLILVDHSPLGVCSELLPMLEQQCARSDEVCIVLGLRDILDDPLRARHELARPEVRRAFTDFYDHVLVYGHRFLCDLSEEYGLPPEVAARLTYVGVVCRLQDHSAVHSSVGRTMRTQPAKVYVTSGGGADGAMLLDPVVEALALAGRDGGINGTIVMGPLASAEAQHRIGERVAGCDHLTVIESAAGPHDLMIEADLVVCMGGYNTIYEALYARCRVLALPRIQPRREQLERVERLGRLGLVSTLGSDEVDDPLPELGVEQVESAAVV